MNEKAPLKQVLLKKRADRAALYMSLKQFPLAELKVTPPKSTLSKLQATNDCLFPTYFIISYFVFNKEKILKTEFLLMFFMFTFSYDHLLNV